MSPRIDVDLSGVSSSDMSGGGGFTSWEQGPYKFLIEETDVKPSKSGKSIQLVVKMVCMTQGPYHGKKKWDFITIEHANPEPQRIGRARLKEIALATDYPNPDKVEDSDAFHGKVVMAFITKKLAKTDYERNNADQQGYVNGFANYGPVEGQAGEAVANQGSSIAGGREVAPVADKDMPF